VYWCRRHLVLLSLIILAVVFSSVADFAVSAEEPSMALSEDRSHLVEGVGALVQRDQAAARTRAVQDALRKAVEKVVEELLDPFVLVAHRQELETHVYARDRNYVQSYRVLWEYPDVSQQVYRVGVEAEVAVDEVAQEIQALGLTQIGAASAQLLVLIVEQQLGQTSLSTLGRHGGVVAQVLRTQLQAQGFRLVSLEPSMSWDGQDNSALRIGKQAGADVVLVGQAMVQKVRQGVAGMPLQAVQATVQVQALATTMGQQLAMARAAATVFHADAILGGQQALENVATKVAARLASPLRRYLQQDQEHSSALRDAP
jgi:hypothetical protein